jgi:hypothetical protein
MNLDAWITPATWAASMSTLDEPDGPPDAIGVEVSIDGTRFAAVAGWRTGDLHLVVRSLATLSATALWAWVDEHAPRVLLLPPDLGAHYAGRCRVERVTSRDNGLYLGAVCRALADGRVLHHPSDHALTEDVARTTVVSTDVGQRISRRKSTGPRRGNQGPGVGRR